MGEGIETQLKKGVLGFCVLALLARGNSYAYEIASKLSRAVDMGEGTIYPLMRRMQTDGLVTTYIEESPAGPPRKYYRITAAGHRALSAQLGEWRAFTAAVESLISAKAPNGTSAAEPQSTPVEAETDHDA